MNNIKIVLINTSHPGNIGASARAMKNMGLSKLVLVTPKCDIDEVAYARCSNATDILDNAEIKDSLDAALSDSHLVFGTRGRKASLAIPQLDVKQAIEVIENKQNNNIAILFGNEQSGLSNAELSRCHYHITIPTSEYASLNLAQAVQILTYEIYQAFGIGIQNNIAILLFCLFSITSMACFTSN